MLIGSSSGTDGTRAYLPYLMLAAVGLGLPLTAGCAARRITFEQDNYINTGVHCGRPAAQRTGQPLEVTIVCVYPLDMDYEVNRTLRPAARPEDGITSQEWYAKRPIPTDQVGFNLGTGRFQIPPDRVYLLTDEEDKSIIYGTKVGPALKGAKTDGKNKVIYAKIDFSPLFLFDKESAIYVFGKFCDEQGRVLRVPPVMFNPPGKYTRDISLRIGVENECEGPTLGQYIRNTTVAK